MGENAPELVMLPVPGRPCYCLARSLLLAQIGGSSDTASQPTPGLFSVTQFASMASEPEDMMGASVEGQSFGKERGAGINTLKAAYERREKSSRAEKEAKVTRGPALIAWGRRV